MILVVMCCSIFGRQIAPAEIAVWNPAFDITPCSLIKGIITELGVAESSEESGSDGIIDMPAFLRSKGVDHTRVETAATPIAAGSGYRTLDTDGVLKYVAQVPDLRRRIGFGEAQSPFDPALVKVEEVGDGNLNLVFIVEGPGGIIVIKQALPYVRCVGESWPLALERNHFERAALSLERSWCPAHVPEVILYDSRMYLFVMEYIPPPHLILRKYFAKGLVADLIDEHLSTFLANTLYKSSALAMKGRDFRLQVSAWSKNTGLCGLTEQVRLDGYTSTYYCQWVRDCVCKIGHLFRPVHCRPTQSLDVPPAGWLCCWHSWRQRAEKISV